MGKNATINVRVDSTLKSQVDVILNELDMPASRLITLLYRQIVLKHSIPFDISLPYQTPLVYENLTDKQLSVEIAKAYKDIEEGRVVPANKVNKMIKKEFGL
ncbi:MAG: type II toxin-antitoxin system RelB/DinJ family antitoxin [Bacilli bacterium]|nr:type II toxin-antitoxin system RelB/DinJ family antitoxin [Bacilli bacterium]